MINKLFEIEAIYNCYTFTLLVIPLANNLKLDINEHKPLAFIILISKHQNRLTRFRLE